MLGSPTALIPPPEPWASLCARPIATLAIGMSVPDQDVKLGRTKNTHTHTALNLNLNLLLHSPRRAALAGIASILLARPAFAAIGVWDGKTPAYGSCPVGAEGDACRVKTLECVFPFFHFSVTGDDWLRTDGREDGGMEGWGWG